MTDCGMTLIYFVYFYKISVDGGDFTKKFILGFKKFFRVLDIYKCPIFTFEIFKSKSCFFKKLQNWCFQTVIDYGVIFGDCKTVYFYAVKKGVPLFRDVIIHRIFRCFGRLLAYLGYVFYEFENYGKKKVCDIIIPSQKLTHDLRRFQRIFEFVNMIYSTIP